MNTQVENLKLMIVDDVEDVCEFMQLYFRRRGFKVFTAKSAEEALPVIKEELPDIIILDVNLPRMNGIELLKIIRQFNDKVKVIMITGYDLEFQKDPEFKKLNVFNVLLKPVTTETLEENITRLLH